MKIPACKCRTTHGIPPFDSRLSCRNATLYTVHTDFAVSKARPLSPHVKVRTWKLYRGRVAKSKNALPSMYRYPCNFNLGPCRTYAKQQLLAESVLTDISGASSL